MLHTALYYIYTINKNLNWRVTIMNFEEMRKTIYQYYINNPCLSEEIDYESKEVRKAYYIKSVTMMSEEDVIAEYEMLQGEGLVPSKIGKLK